MVVHLKAACPHEAAHHVPLGPYCGRRAFRSVAEIVPLIEEVLAELSAAGYEGGDLFGVRLALEEAMVNAIKHGHRGDETKVAQLRYRVTAECVLAEVEDQG